MLHVQDVDYRTTALTLVDALKQVRAWSKAHPRHVPIMILLELKSDPEKGCRPSLSPSTARRSRDSRARSSPSSRVRRSSRLTRFEGSFASLPEAIRKRGWPPLDAVRGRVIFALDNEDRVRDLYLEGHAALEGRLMFASVAETHPAAAWFKINDPIADFERIRRLVTASFLVRTRADADTRQARSGDTTMRDKALSSGAQFVSTDYPVPDPRFTSYRVQLPGRVVACSNPVSGKAEWEGVDLEP